MYESEFIFEVQSGGWSTTKFFRLCPFLYIGAETREPKTGFYQSKTSFYAAWLFN